MAEADPRSVNKLGYKYGFLPAESAEGRAGMIYRGIEEEGENFVRDMAMFHPDRELILAANGEQNFFGESLTVPKQFTDQEMAAGLDKASFTGPVIDTQDPKFMLRCVGVIIVFFLVYQLLMK